MTEWFQRNPYTPPAPGIAQLPQLSRAINGVPADHHPRRYSSVTGGMVVAPQEVGSWPPATDFMKQVWEAAPFLAGSDQGGACTCTAFRFFNL